MAIQMILDRHTDDLGEVEMHEITTTQIERRCSPHVKGSGNHLNWMAATEIEELND
jgi:hypothetical protein